MALHLRHFTVRGRGEFPLDMLRYDSCWPRSGEDVMVLSADYQFIEKEREKCDKCDGKGFYPDPRNLRGRHCEKCEGTRHVLQTRDVQLCKYTRSKSGPVAEAGRWRSFGWDVVKED